MCLYLFIAGYGNYHQLYFSSGSLSSSSSPFNSQINPTEHIGIIHDPWPLLKPQHRSFVPRHNITYPQPPSAGSFPSSAHISPSHSPWAVAGYAQPSFEPPKRSIPRQGKHFIINYQLKYMYNRCKSERH